MDGAPGGLPSMGPGMPQSELEPEVPISKGITEFLKRMDSSNLTEDDELNVEDNSDSDDLYVEDLEVTAQALPEVTEPLTTSPTPPPGNKVAPFKPVEAPAKDITVEAPAEESIETPKDDLEDLPPVGTPIEESNITSDFDSKLDALMSGITVGDAIVELENLSKIFKTREIPRRLSRADMMLDGLGLAPFFPSLSEAQNKALEANNYIATRVDDILAKLRGSMSTKEINLQGDEEAISNPQVDAMKNNLQTDQDKDKARKQMKKDQEVAQLESKTKPTPEIEVQEDLAEPVAPAPTV